MEVGFLGAVVFVIGILVFIGVYRMLAHRSKVEEAARKRMESKVRRSAAQKMAVLKKKDPARYAQVMEQQKQALKAQAPFIGEVPPPDTPYPGQIADEAYNLTKQQLQARNPWER